MRPSEIFELVQADVLQGIGDAFVPRDDVPEPFGFLATDGFEFALGDIPTDADVSAVAWQLLAYNQRPLIATNARAYDGTDIPALLNRNLNRGDPLPPSLALDPLRPGLREALRNVRIVGVTLVVLRDPASDERPMFLRFVDWADVYSQLGFSFSTRPPDPSGAGPGYQRISEVPSNS